MFDYAVRDSALAVLSVQLDDQWRTFKSHFLERDPNHKFIVLDHQETHGAAPAPLSPGQYVGISFRYKSRKVMFASVMEAKGRYVVSDGSSVSAVRYRWPDSLTELQRRAYHRTMIPPGSHLLANIWPGGVAARATNQETPLGVLTGEALDVSCGGTLIRLRDAVPIDWEEGATFGVELQLPDGKPALSLDAYFRGARPDHENQVCAAVQFVGLELSVDGRTALQRLSRCVQRFHRMSQSNEIRESRARRGF